MVIIIRKRARPVEKKSKINTSLLGNSKLIIIILILVIIVVGVIIAWQQHHVDNKDTGDDFVFTSLDGTSKHLSDYRGKVVILDMWATWCSPCQFQMTELKKTYEAYSRDDLEIISIDIDTRETVQLVENFRNAFKQQGIELNWVFGMDDGSIWEKYMLNGGIPTLCIFDREGKLSLQHEGIAVFSEIPQGLSEDTVKLSQKIDSLL